MFDNIPVGGGGSYEVGGAPGGGGGGGDNKGWGCSTANVCYPW